MWGKLADASLMKDLVRSADSRSPESLLDRLVASLSAGERERAAIRTSLDMLPGVGADTAALPKEPPRLVRKDWWV